MITRYEVNSIEVDPICFEECRHHITITLKDRDSFDIVQADGSTIYRIISGLADEKINPNLQDIWETESIRWHFKRYEKTSKEGCLEDLDTTLNRLFQLSLGLDFQK